MNKFFKGALTVGIGCTMLATTALTACGGQRLDTETRPLMLSIGALDDNFNPFFYSSQNDGEMVGMTQISMLTVNSAGKPVCGDDHPTVAQDFKYTMYDTKQVGTGNATGVGTQSSLTGSGSENGRTEYEFLIKNGINFSDGSALTIKDVLFNLYVYLDYAYTGSSTMYSTDIQGLKAYRTQDPTYTDDSNKEFGSTFRVEAQKRITALKDWSKGEGAYGALKKEELPEGDTIKADLAKVEELFKKEIESDWTTVASSWKETYKHAYRFTEVWQAYLFQEGIITVQTGMNLETNSLWQLFEDKNGNGERDDDETNPANSEKYYTTLDKPVDDKTGLRLPVHQSIIDAAADAVTPDKIAQYKIDNAEEGVTITDEMAKEGLWKKYCVDYVFENYMSKSNVADVLTYWATASEVLEKFMGEESTKYFETHKGVANVSGITYEENVKSFNGKNYDEGHSVLKIVINGIDPKAIFNFAFSVAPLKYYSGEWKGTDYRTAFNGTDNFGVAVGDSDFFSKVLGAPEKNALPIGAGAYKATNFNGDDNITGGFKSGDNIMRFKRNTQFESTGKNVKNANIKFVNYKVYNDDQIMEALTVGEIDYGMPNASLTNQGLVTQNSGTLTSVSYRTGGYGYVGINPKFVPEYKIRQAIMKAMNSDIAAQMYGTQLAERINRPMSSTSWAYPKGVTEYEAIKFNSDEKDLLDEINQLVRDSGYTKQGGVLTKTQTKDGMSNAAIGTKLDLKFTIAGESAAEHPSYRMFLAAASTLRQAGFSITVSADPNALKQLSSGNLAVWAAAWSSSVDPDMYQVYHKDSKASNVNNWNYPNILSAPTLWGHELTIINKLSTKIEEGRSKMSESERAPIYYECLDLVMELAVEFPVYQRNDLCVYNKTVIAKNSLVQNPNHNIGLFDKIWEINYV